MHTLADTTEVALTRPAQIPEGLYRSDQNITRFQSVARALYLCMFPPTKGFSSLANTCRDDSTQEKLWGAYRLKDGKQQLSVNKVQRNPRNGRGIDTFETRLGNKNLFMQVMQALFSLTQLSHAIHNTLRVTC